MMIFGIKSLIVLKNNLIANPSTIKIFSKRKSGLTVMGLQILMLEKYLKQILIISVAQ